jgi:hypothetical protein
MRYSTAMASSSSTGPELLNPRVLADPIRARPLAVKASIELLLQALIVARSAAPIAVELLSGELTSRKSNDVFDAIVAFLKVDEPERRTAAVYALSLCEFDDVPSDKLLAFFKDVKSDEAFDAISSFMEVSEPERHADTADAIESAPVEEHLETLKGLAADRDEEIASKALAAIAGTTFDYDDEILAVMERGARHPKAKVRLAVLAMMTTKYLNYREYIYCPAFVDICLRLLSDESADVRERVVSVLHYHDDHAGLSERRDVRDALLARATDPAIKDGGFFICWERGTIAVSSPSSFKN